MVKLNLLLGKGTRISVQRQLEVVRQQPSAFEILDLAMPGVVAGEPAVAAPPMEVEPPRVDIRVF